MKAKTAILTLFFAASAVLQGQETTDDWITRLSSRQYAVRERAARELEHIGAPALPLLTKAMASADLETRKRAAIIIERIEARVVVDALLQPSRLRLRFRDLPLSEALAIVNKIGPRCAAAEGLRRIVNVDTAEQPYWQAWRDFCRGTGLGESDYTRSAATLKDANHASLEHLTKLLAERDQDVGHGFSVPPLSLIDRPAQETFAADERHSVRVRVKWLAVEPAAADAAPRAIFAVEMRPEPRLDIVAMPKVDITKIVDDKGRERRVTADRLLPEALAHTEHANFLSAYLGETQFGGLLHLRAIPWAYPSRHLRELHGQVNMQIAVRPDMIVVNDVFNAVGQEWRGKQGITLKILKAVKKADGTIQLRVFLDRLESLPTSIVRVRPGFVAIRDPVSVAVDRLRLVDPRGSSQGLERLSVEIRTAEKMKGHVVEIVFAGGAKQSALRSLMMADEQRIVSVQMPFVVRSLTMAGK
jgi:hypothetical protein